ncbi:aminotransferase class I/II-fold pyridoxal phosphate-dependent enzyme [Microbacterium imperiale]|uniref:Transcriptional regulator PtsJ n=1 Tax=Microbacterium imperiale TaxID=33884 RepID=A0A9W6M1Y4_9MICO|nr:aminotransferase class I/II-fold pyridoxal phosphate-dependent enzyme [Microbacterium imperiale]MBP2419757.1 DNA-binding transcriptional MocR family regulator [Microbacterium imperiale]MDS0198379.1 aminotransferase class I/II-fold pyridoxal phosphate-dependent enzyme [Microbacterium imperiale]BFE40097.1 aminotransferase class I/II-fold pyridoxal phosphate-dependent enzyme [Microbacterium imperiale]GLJ78928.1 transcriptional regulator PtsJ [Microbacterium imperiale]
MTSRETITGHTAGEIADSVRMLLERGMLRADDALPPVRALADELGVNRNTVVAAYRLLAQAGIVVARGRGGTRIADVAPIAAEGVAADTVLRDVGSGNPDPTRIPDPTPLLPGVTGRPVLYGEPVIDRGLAVWARDWFAADADAAGDGTDAHLTITGGAVDAVERLLAQALTRDDAVALEDPCFLASIHTVRLAGYRALPVPVDAEGMTVAGLEAALEAGARAVVVTPRAQNPTGASLSAERAAALRRVLAPHPYVLVIEDDHFSLLSTQPYRSIIGPGHRRWARVRSVSKFLGPDMCLAVTASDPTTAERMSLRLGSGTTWVSHLLQRLTHALVTDDAAAATIAAAGAHYAARNAAFAERLSIGGLPCTAGDGLSLWIEVPGPARAVADALMRRGWLARTGDEFRLTADEPSRHLRLTVHDLDDDEADALSRDLLAAALTPSRKV